MGYPLWQDGACHRSIPPQTDRILIHQVLTFIVERGGPEATPQHSLLSSPSISQRYSLGRAKKVEDEGSHLAIWRGMWTRQGALKSWLLPEILTALPWALSLEQISMTIKSIYIMHMHQYPHALPPLTSHTYTTHTYTYILPTCTLYIHIHTLYPVMYIHPHIPHAHTHCLPIQTHIHITYTHITYIHTYFISNTSWHTPYICTHIHIHTSFIDTYIHFAIVIHIQEFSLMVSCFPCCKKWLWNAIVTKFTFRKYHRSCLCSYTLTADETIMLDL